MSSMWVIISLHILISTWTHNMLYVNIQYSSFHKRGFNNIFFSKEKNIQFINNSQTITFITTL